MAEYYFVQHNKKQSQLKYKMFLKHFRFDEKLIQYKYPDKPRWTQEFALKYLILKQILTFEMWEIIDTHKPIP